jgi:hypothetical protein
MFDPPDRSDGSAVTRHCRRVLCYLALLFKAGLEPPPSLKPPMRSTPFGRPLVGEDFLNTMTNSPTEDEDKQKAYAQCATLLQKPKISWAEAAQACGILRDFLKDRASGFSDFDSK